MGITGVTLPPDPIQLQPTYATALAAFEQLPSIRVLFDNGAGGLQPGHPCPAFERSWPSWPIPGTTGRAWYLSPGGALGDAPPAAARRRRVHLERPRAAADELHRRTPPPATGGLWTATPPYQWAQSPAGKRRLLRDRAAQREHHRGRRRRGERLGEARRRPNVDLQATISEVRPDGKETFVQGGWVRGNERKLDAAKSTPLEPVLSLRAADVSPLPADKYVEATIPLYYQGHVYRAGSRIRVTIAAPNGDQPIWSFGETRARAARPTVSIARSKQMPSQAAAAGGAG